MKFNFKQGVMRASEVTGVTLEEAGIGTGRTKGWLTSMTYRNNPNIRNVEATAEAFCIPLDKFIEFCLEN